MNIVVIKERNVVIKNPRGKLRVALVYPSEYRVGMANLGMQIIYDLLNSMAEVYCERFFLGYSRSLETGSMLKAFDLILFSWQFELDALNILRALHEGGIPLRREGREEFVLVGGPCAVNPSPLEDFVDAFYIGEAEEKLAEVVQLLMEKEPEEGLEELAGVEGLYLPVLENKAKRVYTASLDSYHPTAQIISPGSAYGEAFLLEISRGCAQGCRFCMGGYIFRPRRERSFEVVKELAEEGLGVNSPKRLVLLGASVTDYSRLEELSRLIAGLGVEVSAPSLHAGTVTPEFMRALASSGQRSVTMAPEACYPLRLAMNKRISDDQLVRAAKHAGDAGIRNLKLYLIFGLPGEREEHIAEAARLVGRLKQESGLRLRVSVNPLVPKPHSAMQWAPLVDEESYSARLRLFKHELGGKAKVKAESHRYSVLQAVIARGDRRLGGVLEQVFADGFSAWKRAFKHYSLSFENYTGELEPGDPLPWEKIDTQARGSMLAREYNKYYQSELFERF